MQKVTNSIATRHRVNSPRLDDILGRVAQFMLGLILVATLILILLFLLSSINDSIRSMSSEVTHQQAPWEVSLVFSSGKSSNSNAIKSNIQSLLDQGVLNLNIKTVQPVKPVLTVIVDQAEESGDEPCDTSDPNCKQIEYFSNTNPKHQVKTIQTVRNAMQEFLSNDENSSELSIKYSIVLKYRQCGPEATDYKLWGLRFLNLKIFGVVFVLLLLFSACLYF
jgi:hypothetical protein